MKRQAFAPSAKRIPELDGLRVLLVFIVVINVTAHLALSGKKEAK